MVEALVLCRFVHFASTMFAFGALAFRRVLLGTPAAVAIGVRLRRVLVVAGAISFGSAIGWLATEGAAMSGTASGAFDPQTLWAVLADTQFGSVWMWRLALALGLVVALAGRGAAAMRLRLPLAFVLLASIGFVGHAAMEAGAVGVAHRLNHAVHLLAAGAWIGGLGLLVPMFADARYREATKVRALERFSLLGSGAVALVLASGAVNSWFLIATPGDLLSSAYGRTLSLKVLLIAGMLALAAFHRFVLLPRAAAVRRTAPLLMRSLTIELGLGVCVIAAASVLGTLPPSG